MRIRSIKPEFWRDPDTTGRWPADLKLFYVGLWMVADDEGRFAWDADLIAADLFPFDRAADVAGLLERLRSTGRVVRYEADGRAFGFLPKFAKHQRINRPSPSRLPAPPEGLPDDSVSPHGRLIAGGGSGSRDQGAGSEEACGEPPADAAAPASPSAPPPTPATKPSPGKLADPRHHPLTEGLMADFAEARGAAYCHAGPKDAKAVASLLALGTQAAGPDGAADEVRRRWRRALALGEKWPGCASLALLPGRWNEIGPSPATRAGDQAAPDPVAVAIAEAERTCPLWAGALRSAVDRAPDKDPVRRWLAPLRARQDGDVLRLTAADRFAATFVRDTFAPGIAEAFGVRVEVTP